MKENALKLFTGIVLGAALIAPGLWAADVGITLDTGTMGSVPSTSVPSDIYTGYSTETTPPQIVSITTNGGSTLSPDGNVNFPSGYNGNPLIFYVLFNEDMITSSSDVNTPHGLAFGDVKFTCTDSSVSVDSQTFQYSTGSSRILELPLTDLLPAAGTCQLLLDRGNDDNGTITATGTIRDVSHNPTPIALYTISNACTLNDDFARNSIGCWSQQNSSNGSFSISSGALNYSSTAGIVTGSSAPALRKTGITLRSGKSDIRVSLTVNSVSLQSGDGIGLRFTDQSGNSAMLIVYNDGSSNRYKFWGSNGSTTFSSYLSNDYNASTNGTMTLHLFDNGSIAAFPYATNVVNNSAFEPNDWTWAGGEFGSSNLTMDIVGIREIGGGTASAVVDNFTVVDGVQ